MAAQVATTTAATLEQLVAQLDEVAEPVQLPTEQFHDLTKEERNVYLSKVRNRTLTLMEVVKQTAARLKVKEAEVAQCSIEGRERHKEVLKTWDDVTKLQKTLKREEQRLIECFDDVTKLWNAIKRDEQSLSAEKQAAQEPETRVDKHSNVVMEGLSELAGVGGNGVQSEEEYRTVLNKYATIAGKTLAAEARRSFRR